MPGKVFITGGSGFVGSAVVGALLSRGWQINRLERSECAPATEPGVTSIPGDLFDSGALDAGVRGVDAVIHLVGIIAERPSRGVTFERIHVQGTRNVVEAAGRNGIRRYLQMSALGTRPDAESDYHRTKFQAEQCVQASGLDWTIIRPSMIHGPGGELMKMEAGWARRSAPPWLFMPYFGAGVTGFAGAGRLQPVYVKDVARAFVDALEKPHTIRRTYALGGANVVTWPQMHRLAAEAIVGKPRLVAPIPAWYARLITSFTPRQFAHLLPFNRDQVKMSQEDNTCDLTLFRTDFGWEPIGFAQSLALYAGKL